MGEHGCCRHDNDDDDNDDEDNDRQSQPGVVTVHRERLDHIPLIAKGVQVPLLHPQSTGRQDCLSDSIQSFRFHHCRPQEKEHDKNIFGAKGRPKMKEPQCVALLPPTECAPFWIENEQQHLIVSYCRNAAAILESHHCLGFR